MAASALPRLSHPCPPHCHPESASGGRRIPPFLSALPRFLPLLLAFLISPLGLRLAFAGVPTPQSPNRAYWLRTGLPLPAQPQSMDPRLQELSEAFGRGDYQECRRLAEAVILSAAQLTRPGAHEGSVPEVLRAEAASFIVQSHLAQGDFRAARTAAQRFHDEDALARVNRIEADYEAKAAWLEGLAATAADPQTRGLAHFWLGHLYQSFTKHDLAVSAYAALISSAPDSLTAAAAVRQTAAILGGGDPNPNTLKRLDTLVESQPNTRSADALAQIYDTLAREHFTRHDLEVAVSAWRRAARFYTDHSLGAQCLLAAAQGLMTLERYDEAQTELDLLTSDPSTAGTKWARTAQYLSAVAFYEADDLETAVSLLRQIVAAPGHHEYREVAEPLLRHLEARLQTMRGYSDDGSQLD